MDKQASIRFKDQKRKHLKNDIRNQFRGCGSVLSCCIETSLYPLEKSINISSSKEAIKDSLINVSVLLLVTYCCIVCNLNLKLDFDVHKNYFHYIVDTAVVVAERSRLKKWSLSCCRVGRKDFLRRNRVGVGCLEQCTGSMVV